MDLIAFQRKLNADLFLKYESKASAGVIKRQSNTSQTLSSEEKQFLTWLADHLDLVHDFQLLLLFIKKRLTYTSFLAMSPKAAGTYLYNLFYNGFDDQNTTEEELLQKEGFTKQTFYAYTKTLTHEIEQWCARINQSKGKEEIKYDEQSIGFYYFVLYPKKKKPSETWRFYLTVRPSQLQPCIQRLIQDLLTFATTQDMQLHFKVATSKYRRDTVVIYGIAALAQIISRLPDAWFYPFTLRFGTPFAKGRTMASDVGKEVQQKIFPTEDASNGSVLCRLIAEECMKFVSRERRLPDTQFDQLLIILHACFVFESD